MGWTWNNNSENKVIMIDKSVARDRYMFRVPEKGFKEKDQVLHNGEIKDVVTWQWPNDDRVFLVPIELFNVACLGGMVRDVISVSGQFYRDQYFPEDRTVITSYRRIADCLGLKFNGRVADELEMCFAYARCFTVLNHPVILQLNKNGTAKKREKVTFGFIDYVSRPDIIDSKPVPKNRAPVNIVISSLYAEAIKKLSPVPLPASALVAAHRAPWRLVTPIKNLAYYLAAQIPKTKVRLLVPTLQEILQLKERKDQRIDKTRKSIENALNTLHPIMVSDYQYHNDGYTITLSGKPSKKNDGH